MNALLDAAAAFHNAGINVIPAANDGTKAPHPDGHSWKRYTTERSTPEQHARWFAGKYDGLGAVTGAISGGLEMLEVEGLAVGDGIDQALADLAVATGLGELFDRIACGYEERTPSGGIHWLYRLADGAVPGNLKLARRPATAEELAANPGDKIKTLIETRGEGGFTVCAPSAGRTHPTGQAWSLEAGGPGSIATITVDERDALFQACRTFDAIEHAPAAAPARRSAKADDDGLRPGDDYNARAEWGGILTPHGWAHLHTYGGTTYWRRPGKSHGVSATTNALGTDTLKVFTSSTAFDSDRTYDKVGALAALEFGGDISACTKALRDRGYGDQTPPSAVTKARAVAEHGGSGTDDSEDATRARWQFTDLGNARRLVDTHRHDIRHVPEWGKWLRWEQSHWVRDDTGEIHRRAKAVVDHMPTEATEAADAGAHDWAKAIAKHWQRSQSAGSLSAMVHLAATEPGIPVTSDQLDADPWAFNVANGTIDLRTGKLHPHDREGLHTKLAPVEYQPEARCQAWEDFVWWCACEDDELYRFLQRAVGYSMTGLVTEQVLLFLHGGGANGKTTFVNVLRAMLGDYALAGASDLIVEKFTESHPTAIADLQGRRMVTVSEIDEGRRMAEATVKQLTGGDKVKARYMRQDFFEFDPSHKLWLLANHKPTIRGTDHGIWRRIKLIPFHATVADDAKDPHLVERLIKDLPGILNWSLKGLAEWRANGLGSATAVDSATEEYRGDSDLLGAFLGEVCTLGPSLQVSAADLYDAYKRWCEDNGERVWSQKLLGSHLSERGLERIRSTGGRHWWRGVRLATRYVDDEMDVAEPGVTQVTHRDKVSGGGKVYEQGSLGSLSGGSDRSGSDGSLAISAGQGA